MGTALELEMPTWVSIKWVKDLLADGADTADTEVAMPTWVSSPQASAKDLVGDGAATKREMPTWVRSPQAPAKDLVGDGAATELEMPTWVSSKWVKDLLAGGADTADTEVAMPTWGAALRPRQKMCLGTRQLPH